MSDDWTKSVNTLSRLALRVALDAPLRPPSSFGGHPPGYGHKAGVWWDTILEIREELDKMGIDWRNAHPQTKKKEK